MTEEPFLALLLTLFWLSLVAIGGLYVILGELHRVVVISGNWLTEAEFGALFALAQASPGPNMLLVTLIGWRMEGVMGGLAATLVFLLPALIIAALVARLWTRWGDSPWFVALRRGLVPVTVGLMLSSASLLIGATASGWASYLIVGAAAALTLATRLHPAFVLGGAAVLGFVGFV